VSILLVGADGAVGDAVVERLLDQGDEVRIVEPDAAAAEHWRALGAYVAFGSPDDSDLVERAAQNVRTIVVLSELEGEPILTGALAAGVGRLVFCVHDGGKHEVGGKDVDFVVLVVPRTRFARRPAIAPSALAEAIDAADDLAGHPRIYVDLGNETGWRELGLDAP
jgi:uncharacterized protein YbjT (DUF2867 family)